MRGRREEQELLHLRWCEGEEGCGGVWPGWMRRGKWGGGRGGPRGDAVRASCDWGHRAGRIGWRQIFATAVGHCGQRREGGCGSGGRATASHSQGDPLRGDGVDLWGHGAAMGAREGQGGGCQAIAIQLYKIGGGGA